MFFFISTYHDFWRSLNIFRLEFRVIFFYYHVPRIFVFFEHFNVRLSSYLFFLITTYHEFSSSLNISILDFPPICFSLLPRTKNHDVLTIPSSTVTSHSPPPHSPCRWNIPVSDVCFARCHLGGETLVSHATPESKQQSMEWRHTSSPTKKTTSTPKIMCTVFWDRKGVLLVDFLPQGSTINAGVCCDTLKKLHHTIQNKWHGMLSRGVVMIHDNTHPHTAAATQNLIMTFGWEQFDHPFYSPDLVPSDFHLFLHLKSFLAGRRFHDDEVKEAVTMCFASQVVSFYDEGIQKLVQRYDRCFNNGGNYVEK